MPANYVLLGEITVSTAVASVTFSNIPQTGYTDLKIVLSARTTYSGGTNDGLSVKYNGNASGYTFTQFYGDGTSAASNAGSAAVGPNVPAASATANTFGNAQIYIPNYVSGNNKSYSIDGVGENNATQAISSFLAVLWSNTQAISSIALTSSSGANFVANSTFSLYGIAALGTTPVIAPKATGGDIVVNDGTYWYHAFLSSGIFTPSQAITCDAMIVAGGAGGGGYVGGGGGAGGLVAISTQAFTATPYAVTVGSGGAGGNQFSKGTNGGNSSITSFTAAVGGGGGASNNSSPNTNGANGGSGGGGAGTGGPVGTGGTATSGQGNNGGSSFNGGGQYGAGGGGGASAAGANGTSSAGGAGGAGSSTYSTWGAATSTGQNSGGTRYYAGGGSGGSIGGASSSGGLGGGGSASTNTAVSNGTVNTGGGAGGWNAESNGTGGAGGSGIVIVRYTVA